MYLAIIRLRAHQFPTLSQLQSKNYRHSLSCHAEGTRYRDDSWQHLTLLDDVSMRCPPRPWTQRVSCR